ncbi:LysM peptidoglycan-binding domain-containing protein, partial [Agathobacter sp.]
NGSDNRPFNKYYTSIQVEDGDTLWSIADKYIGENSVDKESYVNDICRMNNLTDGQIHSGEYIIVAYYSHDIK